MVRTVVSFVSLVVVSTLAHAEDKVLSGPQPGDKLTPFKVLAVLGPQAGKEIELASDAKPSLFIIVHEWTRPTLQLVRPVDTLAERWTTDGLTTHVITLSGDREKTQMFLERAKDSLKLNAPASVSLDGQEGPTAFGLNSLVNVTILVTKEGKVVANFAITSPNETDAPKVLAAVAKLMGKPAPTADEIAQANGRPAAKSDIDPELAPLLRQIIQADNDEAKVKEIAEAMRKWAGDNERKQAQLKAACKRVLERDLGIDAAKKALKRLAGE